MKQYFFVILILILGFSGCKSSKNTKKRTSSSTKVITKKAKTQNSSTLITDYETINTSTNIAQNIINFARQFEGVRYKWGGTTKSGMDCSGLVHESFKAYDIYLPRISRDIAKKGKKLTLRETLKGDLLFFKTGKNRRNAINHVGLVIEIKNNAIYFIHASTSKGVIISSLNENYWKSSFIEVRRVL